MARLAAFGEGSGKAAPRAGDMVPLHDGTQGQLWSPGGGPNKWHVVGADRSAHIWDSKTGCSVPAADTAMALANHRLGVDRKYERYGGGDLTHGRSLNITPTDIKQLHASAKATKAKR